MRHTTPPVDRSESKKSEAKGHSQNFCAKSIDNTSVGNSSADNRESVLDDATCAKARRPEVPIPDPSVSGDDQIDLPAKSISIEKPHTSSLRRKDIAIDLLTEALEDE